MPIISTSMFGSKRKLIALVLFMWLMGAESGLGQRAGTFSLFDDGVDDAPLLELRARAVAAVAARDVRQLRTLIDREATSSFGASSRGGVDELIAYHRLDRKDSPAWTELAIILDFGGGYSGGGRDHFVMPYVAASRYFGIEFGWCVAMGAVQGFSQPRLDAEVITTLQSDLLPIEDTPGTQTSGEWRAVRIDTGRVAFVQSQLCRSGHDLRVHFGRTSAGWKITAIIGGD